MMWRSLVAVAIGLATLTAGLSAATTALAQTGRLFFTPAERAELEQRRFAPPPPKPAAAAPSLAPDAPPQPEYITVNGHVWRASGKTTTWVNGVPRHDASRGDAASVQVRAGDRGPQIPLKVGQTYERLSGERTDPLRGGQVRVNPVVPDNPNNPINPINPKP